MKKDCIILMMPTDKDSVLQMHIGNRDFQPVVDYKIPYRNPPAIFQNQVLLVIGEDGIYATTYIDDEHPMVPIDFIKQFIKDDEYQIYEIEVNDNNTAHIQGSDFVNINKKL